MAIQRSTVRYDVDGVASESLAVWDDAGPAKRPAVLIAPSFMGRTGFEEAKAEALAALGYVGFAIDIYGSAVRPSDFESAAAAMAPLNADRSLIARRMQAALDQARGLAAVDGGKVAAIGFCFGGKCVLDLARSGADVAGVVSFHGIFDAPPFATAQTIAAKVLALHGWDDPLAKPDDVIALAKELTDKRADWQLHAYGHTQHGFTNQARPEMYQPDSDRRAWQAMRTFLGELFG